MIKKIFSTLLICNTLSYATTVTIDKNTYLAGESIYVTLQDMEGTKQDWIAIYPKGIASDDWENINSWEWTNGIENGKIKLNGVSQGEYEVRAFFDNSTKKSASTNISVKAQSSTIYEDAENIISNKWRTLSGNYKAKRVTDGFHSKGALKLTTEWINETKNIASYSLPINNSYQKILEMDIGGVGTSGGLQGGYYKDYGAGFVPHFFISLHVDTDQGYRIMTWDSFFNHGEIEAFKEKRYKGAELLFPSPIEHVRGEFDTDINEWSHFRVDLNDYLHQLEPDNNVVFVKELHMSGGFVDNIKLSSH